MVHWILKSVCSGAATVSTGRAATWCGIGVDGGAAGGGVGYGGKSAGIVVIK